ncbi:MAG: hypothetical protein K2X47_12065 [Bdellovibrionales bacterium]|nr:hypothetical protein [Bdellovibrionales bacterium]
MNYIGIALVSGTILFSALGAEANYTHCRWSAEGTNSMFQTESHYSAPPLLIAATACNGPGSTKPDAKPTCAGNVFCISSNPGFPPKVLPVGCEAVKVNNRWQCPAAFACVEDQNVLVNSLEKVPGPVVRNGERPAGGSGMGEGVGGR